MDSETLVILISENGRHFIYPIPVSVLEQVTMTYHMRIVAAGHIAQNTEFFM